MGQLLKANQKSDEKAVLKRTDWIIKCQHIKKTVSLIENFKCILDVIVHDFNQMFEEINDNSWKQISNTKTKVTSAHLSRRAEKRNPKKKILRMKLLGKNAMKMKN